MAINIVCISGNLTRDPDLRESAVGNSILTFGMAVNDRRKNPQTGEWEDYPNFVDCVLFGKRAESLGSRLHKGSKVVVSGRIHYSSWDGKDGSKRSKLEVYANDIDFISPRREQPEQFQQQYQEHPAQPTQSSVFDADVPF